jgi:hypothetical protein
MSDAETPISRNWVSKSSTIIHVAANRDLLGIRVRMQLPFPYNPILHRVLLTVIEVGNFVASGDLTSWSSLLLKRSATVVTEKGKGM